MQYRNTGSPRPLDPADWPTTNGPQEIRGLLWRHGTGIRAGVAAILVVTAVVLWLRGDDTPPLHDVWVADRDLPAGSTLTPGDLRSAQDSLGLRISPRTVLEGSTLRVDLAAGEPLLAGMLAQDRGSDAFPLTLPPAASLAGVAAGDHLDIMAADGSSGAEWRTVVHDIEVLAVKSQDRSDPSVALLAATPEQALALAEFTDPLQIAVTIRS